MDKALNTISLKFGIPGLIIAHAGMYFSMALGYEHPRAMPGWMMAIVGASTLLGIILFVVGLSYYATAKGHSRWAGLLGLLSVVGLFVLAALPDRRRELPPPPRAGLSP